MDVLGTKLKMELEDFCSNELKLRAYESTKQIESLDIPTKERLLNQLLLKQKIKNEIGHLKIEDPEATKIGLKIALDHYDCTLAGDIESYIKKGDIVEIYDSNFIQLHHNFVFYYYCSYDLLSLSTMPMHELYSRPEEITQKIVSEAMEILKNPVGVRPIRVPTHYIKEKILGTPRVFEIKLKYGTAVLDKNGNPAGFISTNECKTIDFHAV